MKKILLSLLVILLAVSVVDAQSDRRKKPKKKKGNHSNKKKPRGFSSINSVMYSSRANEDVTAATLMTPQGWGSNETFAFMSTGGTPNQVYSDNSDMYSQFGFGVGNSQKAVSVVGILNMDDVSKFSNFSASFVVSRQLSKKSSISVGALDLFSDPNQTDFGESFYVAYSRILTKKLSYTVGVGNGLFLENSDEDIKAGKMARGTAVFGALSYQATKNVNVNAEWTGTNVCLSSSVRIKPGWPVVSFGVNDLTRLTSDKPYFSIGIGQALLFNRHR